MCSIVVAGETKDWGSVLRQRKVVCLVLLLLGRLVLAGGVVYKSGPDTRLWGYSFHPIPVLVKD